ncbi:MAG: hypothetical protein QQN51_07930, partial [Nitrosopumilus sp.]
VEESHAGKASWFEVVSINFKARKEDLDEEILEETTCLDDILIIKEYDDLKEIFLQTATDDDEDEDEDKDKKKKKKSKKKKDKKKKDKDEDSDEDKDGDKDDKEAKVEKDDKEEKEAKTEDKEDEDKVSWKDLRNKMYKYERELSSKEKEDYIKKLKSNIQELQSDVGIG